jgi:hypothetical protein
MDDKQSSTKICKKGSRKRTKKRDEDVSLLFEDDHRNSLKKSLELFLDDFMNDRNQPGAQRRINPFD